MTNEYKKLIGSLFWKRPRRQLSLWGENGTVRAQGKTVRITRGAYCGLVGRVNRFGGSKHTAGVLVGPSLREISVVWEDLALVEMQP